MRRRSATAKQRDSCARDGHPLGGPDLARGAVIDAMAQVGRVGVSGEMNTTLRAIGEGRRGVMAALTMVVQTRSHQGGKHVGEGEGPAMRRHSALSGIQGGLLGERSTRHDSRAEH